MSAAPEPLRIIDPVWIPLSDGARLSARIWLPESAQERQPVPAILEYLPYRKDDVTAQDDALRHAYISGPRLRVRACRHEGKRRLRWRARRRVLTPGAR